MEARHSISKVISALREELSDAALRGGKSDIAFDVQQVELELSVSITTSDEVKGGLKFYVVNVGSSVSENSSETQRVKLVLGVRRRSTGELFDVRSDEFVPRT